MEELRQLLNRVKPWVLLACMLGVILIGYFAVHGFRYWQASSSESSLAKEINVLDGKIDAISPVGNLEEKLEALKVRLQAEEKLLEDENLLLEELNGLFQYPSTDNLLKIIATTAQEQGLNLVSITTGDLQTEKAGDMAYQVRRVGLTLGGEPEDFFKFLAKLQETISVASATDVRLTLDEFPSARVTLLFFLSPVAVPTPTPVPQATAVPYPTPTPGPPSPLWAGPTMEGQESGYTR